MIDFDGQAAEDAQQKMVSIFGEDEHLRRYALENTLSSSLDAAAWFTTGAAFAPTLMLMILIVVLLVDPLFLKINRFTNANNIKFSSMDFSLILLRQPGLIGCNSQYRDDFFNCGVNPPKNFHDLSSPPSFSKSLSFSGVETAT
jgi:hypothetical protein